MSEKIEVTRAEYTVQMFPADMPLEQRKAMLTDGYVPYYEGDYLAGRAYLSEFIPAGAKEGESPTAEIKITPTQCSNVALLPRIAWIGQLPPKKDGTDRHE